MFDAHGREEPRPRSLTRRWPESVPQRPLGWELSCHSYGWRLPSVQCHLGLSTGQLSLAAAGFLQKQQVREWEQNESHSLFVTLSAMATHHVCCILFRGERREDHTTLWIPERGGGGVTGDHLPPCSSCNGPTQKCSLNLGGSRRVREKCWYSSSCQTRVIFRRQNWKNLIVAWIWWIKEWEILKKTADFRLEHLSRYQHYLLIVISCRKGEMISSVLDIVGFRWLCSI